MKLVVTSIILAFGLFLYLAIPRDINLTWKPGDTEPVRIEASVPKVGISSGSGGGGTVYLTYPSSTAVVSSTTTGSTSFVMCSGGQSTSGYTCGWNTR